MIAPLRRVALSLSLLVLSATCVHAQDTPAPRAAELNSSMDGELFYQLLLGEVNALGGRIETSTTPGQGTSFKLVLP